MRRKSWLAILSAAALAATLAATLLGLLLGPSAPPVRAQAESPWTLVFSYDCDAAPWACDGPKTESRWQLWGWHWSLQCSAPACPFTWLSRANPAVTTYLRYGGMYRLWFGPDEEPGDIASVWPLWRADLGEVYLDAVYRCDRNPQVCQSPGWQLYECVKQPDGSCSWEWLKRIRGVEDGDYTILSIGQHYLLHWGAPRLLPTPTPTVPPSPTLSPTASPTVTPTPSPSPTTGRPPVTPSPTPRPGRSIFLPWVVEVPAVTFHA